MTLISSPDVFRSRCKPGTCDGRRRCEKGSGGYGVCSEPGRSKSATEETRCESVVSQVSEIDGSVQFGASRRGSPRLRRRETRERETATGTNLTWLTALSFSSTTHSLQAMTTLLTRRLPLTTLRLLNSTSSTTHHLTSVPRSFHSSPLALHPSTPPPPAPLHSFQPHPTGTLLPSLASPLHPATHARNARRKLTFHPHTRRSSRCFFHPSSFFSFFSSL